MPHLTMIQMVCGFILLDERHLRYPFINARFTLPMWFITPTNHHVLQDAICYFVKFPARAASGQSPESELLMAGPTKTRCTQAGLTSLLKKLIATSDQVDCNKEVVINLLCVLQIYPMFNPLVLPLFCYKNTFN
jgi:hypothetical protein